MVATRRLLLFRLLRPLLVVFSIHRILSTNGGHAYRGDNSDSYEEDRDIASFSINDILDIVNQRVHQLDRQLTECYQKAIKKVLNVDLKQLHAVHTKENATRELLGRLVELEMRNSAKFRELNDELVKCAKSHADKSPRIVIENTLERPLKYPRWFRFLYHLAI